MKKLWVAASTLAAAGLAYFLDHRQGGQGRRLLRNKMTAMQYKVEDNAKALTEQAKIAIEGPEATNETLVQRVRSHMGQVIVHAGAIDVSADSGRVTLSGPVLASEVDKLLAVVKVVPGVKDIQNKLEVHETAGNIPALQGEGRQS